MNLKNAKAVNMSHSKIFPKQEGEDVSAQCPICGNSYTINTNWNAREGHLCGSCTASGRSQAIAFMVSKYVFGNETPLAKQDKRTDLKVIGLSDGQIYAQPLSKICDYTNSYYHQEPYLDITNPPDHYLNSFDALISADVFEHVFGDPCHPFRGANRILKPGGHLILTVPFVNQGGYQEHYPGMVGYESKQMNGQWVAEIEYANGYVEIDEKPKFHGGPGKTLEVRLFNRKRLREELEWAGFEDITFHDENLPHHGINWSVASRPITARKPS